MSRKVLMGMLAILLAVPSSSRASTTVDLTTAGASSTQTAAIGGSFTVTQIDQQPTGTGVIDSFLRIQANGSEQGYNTSLSNPLDDVANSPGGQAFTRALQLSEVPIVNINGTDYRQFLLDINQATGSGDTKGLLSLNQIQIFQAPADTDANTTPSTATSTSAPVIGFDSSANATEVFRMNNANDPTFKEIVLQYSLNSGSGTGDMYLYVPNADFSASNGSNVILYSQFGDPAGSNASNDGIEEWAVVKAVPEPSTMVLALSGLVGFGLARVRRGRRA